MGKDAAASDPGVAAATQEPQPSTIGDGGWMSPEKARRTEFLTVVVLSGIYVAMMTLVPRTLIIQSPAAQLIIHGLFLLGFAVFFLGLWDLLALRGLRRLLQRDRDQLVIQARRRRLIASREVENLGGGVIQSAVHRYLAFGQSSARLLRVCLAEALSSVRLGERFLRYAISSAPLLGLMGTILGLSATFRNPELLESGSMQLDRAMPFLGIALTTTMLGIGITLGALCFSELVNRSVASDCHRLVSPIVEIITHEADLASFETGGKGARLRGSEVASMDRRSCSAELGRSRSVSFGLSFLATALLIVAISRPGGLSDKFLSEPVDAQQPVAVETSESRSQPLEPLNEFSPESLEPEEERFEVQLSELLLEDLYDQGVEPQEAEQVVFAFLQYRAQWDSPRGDFAESRLVRTYHEDRVPIGGFIDQVTPSGEEWKVRHVYPPLVARLDCLVRGDQLSSVPAVTYAELEGPGIPWIKTVDYRKFMEVTGDTYPRRWGQILDRSRIQDLLSPTVIRAYGEKSADGWRNGLGRPAGDDEEHLVLWMLYEPAAKFAHVLESFDSHQLKGQVGDYVILDWEVDSRDAQGLRLRGIRTLSPKEVSLRIIGDSR